MFWIFYWTVANYDVSIKIAVAGAKQLDKVNKKTAELQKNINEINRKAEQGTAGMPVVRNFENLSKAVTDARSALDKAAIGTKEFNQAVKNVVKVEDKFNRQQKIKNRALKVEELRIKEGLTLKLLSNNFFSFCNSFNLTNSGGDNGLSLAMSVRLFISVIFSLIWLFKLEFKILFLKGLFLTNGLSPSYCAIFLEILCPGSDCISPM